MTRLTYAIFTVIFLSLSLIGAIVLVKQSQDTRNLAQSACGQTDETKTGGCGDANCCRSWEVYQNGCCHSTSGCTQNSDCLSGKSCNNGTCEGGTPATCDQCSPISDDNKRCFGTTEKHCGNDGCWHYDPAKNDNTKCANSTPVPTSGSLGGQTGSPQCANSSDSGCTTGGRGGVDCADCRRTNGQVKQCTDGVWYCCYSNGECFKGDTDEVVCSGTTITNNTNQTLPVDTYSGCETNNKIDTTPLAPGQSTSAGDCKQLDVVNYCGVCNPNNCQTTPPPRTPPTNTPRPTNTPTNTPTPTLTPTGTLVPTDTPTNTPVPNATNTPTPTPTPTSTIDDRQSNSPVPTRIILPEAGVDLPSRFLLIFGSIVTLIGFLVLI